jgi:tetratricopeptide (TPR) repeat protein
MELGEFDAARASLESALALAPASLPAHLRLAQAIAASGRSQDAVVQYRRILEQHPDCPQAWYGLGRSQKLSGDGAGALKSYAKACELFPEYAAAHFALAQELRRLGQIEEARSHARPQGANNAAEPPLDDPVLERVARLNRGTRLPMQRAADLERAGRLEDAVREQERALAADPSNVQSHVNLISLYGRLDNPETAKEHFEAVLRLQPNRSDAWYNYGVLLLREHKDLQQAEKAFLRALNINPDYAEARNNLGVIYEEAGRLDDAASEFRKAIASRPDYPLARFHLGRILLHQKKYEDAVHQFLRARRVAR